MTRTSTSGFQTEQEQQADRKSEQSDASARRASVKPTLEATAQRLGPIIRDSLLDFFRGLGASTVDYTGDEQVALFEEKSESKTYAWKAWSWKKTGTHTEYRPDGTHQLDEHTAYSVTVSLAVDRNGLPLLRVGEYATSKLVGKKAVVASSFAPQIPSRLQELLENRTGIKLAETAAFLRAVDE